jgi:pyruvate,water dikinase
MFDKLGELADSAGRPDLYLKLCSGYGESEESRMITALLAIARGTSTIEEFLHHYGARCPGEVELSARSWRENPDAVVKLVGRYRAAENRVDPAAEVEERSQQRIAAERDLLACLPGARRPGARLLFRLARTYIPLREQGKSVMVTPIDGGRFAARARGRELVAEGAIDDVEDVFYLTLEEILTDPPRDARQRVEHRRRLADEYAKITVPTLWSGTPEPVLPVEERGPVEAITGIAAAAGAVEGYARVLTDPDDSDQLSDDEILVCRITDPAWAAAFYLAAAVVIDIGGLSSHGAIVCREMGLPCVINTVNGTRAIRTGDRIRVDGDTGLVTILERAVRAPT